jgi:hypothetical protein
MIERTHLGEDDILALASDSKLGFLATRDPDGRPHLTLITTLQARTPTELTWGQFCEGRSKDNVRRDPRTAFLVMNLRKQWWRGRATWTRGATEGEDFESYNRKPLFRYNSYFGIHTVHFMDLVAVTPRAGLSMPRIVAGSLLAATVARASGRRRAAPAMNDWSRALIDRLDTLKFVAWIRPDGWPEIAPVIPASTADAARLVLADAAAPGVLDGLAAGADVAVLTMNLAMESVVVAGRFGGFRGVGPLRAGTIDVDRVYNSMPPKHGPIWPQPSLEPVAHP